MDSTSVGQLLKISKHGHIWLFKNLHIKQHDGSKLPKFLFGLDPYRIGSLFTGNNQLYVHSSSGH